MKLICINKENNNINTTSTVDLVGLLIIGQEYTLTCEDKGYYRIKEFGDFGFYKYRFATTKEYRKLKLKKINETNQIKNDNMC